MPKETDRLKLPLPLGNETVSRESINGIFEKIDAGVATQADLDTLREAVSQMDIPDASLTQKGQVQLSSKTDGTSETVAATEKAVRDARVAAINSAQAYVDAKSWQKHRFTNDESLAFNISNQNLNNIIKTGFYAGENITNGPLTAVARWYYIEVIAMSPSHIKQIAMDLFGNTYQQRTNNGTTWTAWSEDLFTSVSNGKASIAAAITDKGVSTAANASFATMASNVTKVKQAHYQSTTSPAGFINSGSGVPFVLATFPGGTSIISAYGRTPIGSSIFNDRWSVQSKASDKFELRLRDANGVDWILSTHNYIGSNGTTNDSVNSFWSIAQIHVNLLSGVAMVVARVDSYVSWNNVHQGGYGYSNSTTKPNGGFDNSRNFSLIVVSEGSVNFPGNNSALIVESM
jgi:hypothetical protein